MKTEERYDVILASNKNKWIAKDFKLAIQRHHGVEPPPKGETSLQPLSAKDAKSIYDKKYKNCTPPPSCPWAARMEAKLARLMRGEINSAQEIEIYGRTMQSNLDYIVYHLQSC